MNLSQFFDAFKVTISSGDITSWRCNPLVGADFAFIIAHLGGKTFNDGVYRVLRGDKVELSKESMERCFPEMVGRILPFGYDWLGRHFAVELNQLGNGMPKVILLEPGAGEVTQIPVSIGDFHNKELVEYGDDALALKFFHQWCRLGHSNLMPNQCVGYRVPLFLGGKDEVSNLEIIDMDVYIELCGQLRQKVRTMSDGQTIRDISMKD